MDGGGSFDDPLFADFTGMGLSATSTLLSAKAQADTRGNVHSIHVMLGLQHSHSDMMFGKALKVQVHNVQWTLPLE